LSLCPTILDAICIINVSVTLTEAGLILLKLVGYSSLVQELTAPVLISHLINAHHHLLALRLFEYLGLNQVTSLAKKIFVLSLLSFNSLMNQKETLPEFLWLSSAF